MSCWYVLLMGVVTIRIIMWRELALRLHPNCTLATPASEQQIKEIEAALSVSVPEELRSLLLETNGILGQWSDGPVLPAEDMRNLNINFRNNLGDLYPTFYSRFFIAASGGGDLWGYKVNSDRTITDTRIYIWDHELAEEEPEESAYSVVDDSLQTFVERRLKFLATL